MGSQCSFSQPDEDRVNEDAEGDRVALHDSWAPSCCSSIGPVEVSPSKRPRAPSIEVFVGFCEAPLLLSYSYKSRVPDGKKLTVMMLGMSGSGKSALANLLAGADVFRFGDDTESMTTRLSPKTAEVPSGSLLVLDTIGLSDSSITHDEVIHTVREQICAAPDGIDMFFLVLPMTRLTDDEVVPINHMTDKLWSNRPPRNLYIVITRASKFVQNREQGLEWIRKQINLNWRFKLIAAMVANSPHRFIFIDNPDPRSKEPGIAKRQSDSFNNMMVAFNYHLQRSVHPFGKDMLIPIEARRHGKLKSRCSPFGCLSPKQGS